MIQRQRTALVLDDFPDAAEALAAWFSLEGWDAQAYTSVTEASHSITQQMPDLVIVEPYLRQGGGMAFSALVRSLGGSELFLIAVTGHQRQGDETAYEPTLFDRTLVKPVSQELLREALRHCGPVRR